MSFKRYSVKIAAGYLLTACIILLTTDAASAAAFKGLIFQPGKQVAANSGKSWRDSGDYIFKDPSLSIYQNKITFEPNDIVIPQDSTVSIKIAISSVPNSQLPLCIWAHYGYREADASFVDANWDEITVDGQTPVKPVVQVAKKNEFSFACSRNAIIYNLPEASPVSLKIYDLKGSLVASSVFAVRKAGQYKASGVIEGLGAGKYMCIFNVGAYNARKVFNVIR